MKFFLKNSLKNFSGKSGVIGDRFAASLSSIGIASHFVHVSEWAHGDLGKICLRIIFPTDLESFELYSKIKNIKLLLTLDITIMIVLYIYIFSTSVELESENVCLSVTQSVTQSVSLSPQNIGGRLETSKMVRSFVHLILG